MQKVLIFGATVLGLFALDRVLKTKILTTGKFIGPMQNIKRRLPVGAFGAHRKAVGNRPAHKHQGLDFLGTSGAAVLAPMSGKVRVGRPYSDDSRFSLVEVKAGSYGVKIMYVSPVVKTGQNVEAGQVLGYLQDLGIKFGASYRPQNHVHVEVRKGGIIQNPDQYFEKDTAVA